ncbi:MAG: TetR/AcrR family transcriptional regulator [Candidatus Latescibacterota bacterium]|jgi:AcrR family transcriptional regulator
MARLSKKMQQIVRERLVETAARHFGEYGLEGARIDAISQDAGFAKGTVYNYFESKQDLFGAVVEEGARRAAERFRHADPGGEVRVRLLAVAEADVSVVREEEAFIKVLVREAMSFRPETYPIIEAHLAPYVTAVAGVLRDGVDKSTVRNDTPVEQLALLFVGTLSMLYVQHWGSNGAWPTLEAIPALAVTSFLDGAAPRAREETP